MTIWRSSVFRWSVWWGMLAVLTWALLSPQPPNIARALLPAEKVFSASKAVHVSSFAFMTALVMWLPATSRQRFALWVLLALYAGLTEVGQTFVPGRYGSVADVLINHAGMLLGLALAWRIAPWFPPAPEAAHA